MHILDFVMYFVTLFILWKIMDIVSNGVWVDAKGSAFLAGFAVIIYTTIYIIVFVICDNNWIDIFKWTTGNIKW